MRIDILLNKLCLTKTRSIAKNACDKNLVWLNGKHVKASQIVKIGDMIRFDLYGFSHEIEIILIPQGNVPKKDALQYYKLISRMQIE